MKWKYKFILKQIQKADQTQNHEAAPYEKATNEPQV